MDEAQLLGADINPTKCTNDGKPWECAEWETKIVHKCRETKNRISTTARATSVHQHFTITVYDICTRCIRLLNRIIFYEQLLDKQLVQWYEMSQVLNVAISLNVELFFVSRYWKSRVLQVTENITFEIRRFLMNSYHIVFACVIFYYFLSKTRYRFLGKGIRKELWCLKLI